MKLSDFDYHLPKELIAQYPQEERDCSRLLVLNRKKQEIHHRIFKDIPEYINAGEFLVLNNTKVLPSRIIGRKVTGGKIDILLVARKSERTFGALIKPSGVKIGQKIIFNGGRISGVISAKNEITFNTEEAAQIYSLGRMPLPPYIKREPEELDNVYYQTVYADKEGAIASPTAGLHFTEELLAKIESSGVNIGYITLHVGYSTFKPVKEDDITKHIMEPEYFEVPEYTQRLIESSRNENKRIFAVGTTTLRSLETVSLGRESGLTDLFIYPGYKFKIVDCLLTNFHLPRTTLFMLVCAFAGEKFAKKAYQEAIDKKYRFYSYGDAMLIL